jgi:hypothetical protein
MKRYATEMEIVVRGGCAGRIPLGPTVYRYVDNRGRRRRGSCWNVHLHLDSGMLSTSTDARQLDGLRFAVVNGMLEIDEERGGSTVMRILR